MSIAARAPRESLTIAQLSRRSGTTPRALRFYEEKGLLSPQRKDQARIYSHRDTVRLQLILQGRRAGFTLSEVRELFETYDKDGLDAQLARALPLFKERLAALMQKNAEIADAIEALKAASDQMAVKLGASDAHGPEQAPGFGGPAGRATPQSRQPLRDLFSPKRRQG